MTFILKILNYASPLLALIGTYLLILAWERQHAVQHTIKNGRRTEGTVIDLRIKDSKSESTHETLEKAAVVEFQTGNGSYLHYSSTYHYPSRYQVGQKVPIYYVISKSRQEFALIDDLPGNLPNTLLKLGLLSCILGYPFLLSKIWTLLF